MNFKTRFSRKTSFQTVLSFSNIQVSFPRNLRRKFHIKLLHPTLIYYRILPLVTLNAYQVMFISDICLKLGNLFQMAITGHRNALGDITKQQNLPKNAAAKDALGKVNFEFLMSQV